MAERVITPLNPIRRVAKCYGRGVSSYVMGMTWLVQVDVGDYAG